MVDDVRDPFCDRVCMSAIGEAGKVIVSESMPIVGMDGRTPLWGKGQAMRKLEYAGVLEGLVMVRQEG